MSREIILCKYVTKHDYFKNVQIIRKLVSVILLYMVSIVITSYHIAGLP